jgi:chemotaxis signal transduction protein
MKTKFTVTEVSDQAGIITVDLDFDGIKDVMYIDIDQITATPDVTGDMLKGLIASVVKSYTERKFPSVKKMPPAMHDLIGWSSVNEE